MTILDVRWQLAEPDGRAAYEAGHIPGAVYVSLDDELSDHAVTGRGRHPLPSGRDLEAAARRWGVRHGVPVVVYDDWNRAGSARAWWVLTAAGIDDVRILDGGLSAWRGPLESGSVTPQPGDITVKHDDLYAGALPDAHRRAGERCRGDVCWTRGRPNVSAATSSPSIRSPGTFPGPATCRAQACWTPTGVSCPSVPEFSGAVGAYCGSGVTASVVVAALAAAGVDAALYPGSWSEWSSESTRPVERG